MYMYIVMMSMEIFTKIRTLVNPGVRGSGHRAGLIGNV